MIGTEQGTQNSNFPVSLSTPFPVLSIRRTRAHEHFMGSQHASTAVGEDLKPGPRCYNRMKPNLSQTQFFYSPKLGEFRGIRKGSKIFDENAQLIEKQTGLIPHRKEHDKQVRGRVYFFRSPSIVYDEYTMCQC